jgi:hypothetical protein
LWNVPDPAYLGSGDRARNEQFVAARIGELTHHRDRLSSRHLSRRLTEASDGHRLVVR